MSEIADLYAVRLVTKNSEEYTLTRRFYQALLDQEPFREFGDSKSLHEAAFFRLGGLELVVTREEEPTPESGIRQAPVWLCLRARRVSETLCGG